MTVGKVETFSGTGNAARTEVKSVRSKAKHAIDFIAEATPGITQLGGERNGLRRTNLEVI